MFADWKFVPNFVNQKKKIYYNERGHVTNQPILRQRLSCMSTITFCLSMSSSPFLEAYEPLDVIGNGSFGIIRKVRRKSDGIVCPIAVRWLNTDFCYTRYSLERNLTLKG